VKQDQVVVTEGPDFHKAVQDEATRLFEAYKEQQEADAKKKEEAAQAAKSAAEKEEREALERAKKDAKAKKAKESDLTQPLYGNHDEGKNFNLRVLMPKLPQLPDNKVIIVKQTYFKKPSGKTEEDVDMREIQFVDPQDFEAWSKTSETNGLSVYDALGVNFTLLHKPE
jgi:hypothetical protein